MLWVLIRNEFRHWIAQRFRELPASYHYQFVDEYLRKQVDAGKGNYFHALLDSQRKV